MTPRHRHRAGIYCQSEAYDLVGQLKDISDRGVNAGKTTPAEDADKLSCSKDKGACAYAVLLFELLRDQLKYRKK